jgi:hypothetical protein
MKLARHKLRRFVSQWRRYEGLSARVTTIDELKTSLQMDTILALHLEVGVQKVADGIESVWVSFSHSVYN